MTRELPLPYVPIDPGIEDSIRFGELSEQLSKRGSPDKALVILVRIFMWLGRHPNAKGGLPASPKRLARICKWKGDPDALVSALVAACWVSNPDCDVMYLLGYERWGGKVLARRGKWRTDKQKQQDAGEFQVESTEHPPGKGGGSQVESTEHPSPAVGVAFEGALALDSEEPTQNHARSQHAQDSPEVHEPTPAPTPPDTKPVEHYDTKPLPALSTLPLDSCVETPTIVEEMGRRGWGTSLPSALYMQLRQTDPMEPGKTYPVRDVLYALDRAETHCSTQNGRPRFAIAIILNPPKPVKRQGKRPWDKPKQEVDPELVARCLAITPEDTLDELEAQVRREPEQVGGMVRGIMGAASKGGQDG